VGRRHRKTSPGPQKARAKRTIAVLLDAAEKAITEHGIERFTTAQVAQISGLAIGTVYKYFDDRVAILDAIRPHRFDADQTLTEISERLQRLRTRTTDRLPPEDQKVLDELIALTGRPGKPTPPPPHPVPTTDATPNRHP
jgi:AcrR family transcriptional regulator